MMASTLVSASDGLIAVKSPHSAKDTMSRLENVMKQRGLNVFARVDHAAGAARTGKTLRPTEVLIFGNPQGGTPFMCALLPASGLDEPLAGTAFGAMLTGQMSAVTGQCAFSS